MEPPTQTAAPALHFWDTAFGHLNALSRIDPEQYARQGSVTQQVFLRLIGDVGGLNILEIGCGKGELSVFLAQCGANVTATDFSKNAIERTLALAEHNGTAERVQAYEIDALSLPSLGKTYDMVVGRFVLHHIEPFDMFARVIHAMLEKGGRGVFMENNASNPFLMFARKYIAGRMGIPRYGDDEEYPLEASEIALLSRTFSRVNQYYPELVFFRKLDTYLFRHNKRFAPLLELNRMIDSTLYKLTPGVRKYSYLQLVEMVK